MEDSSTNPYIPQESQDVRQKVYQRQSPLGRIVKWLLIATIALALLVGIGLFFVVPRTTAVDNDARQQLADILQPPEQTLKRVNVQSEVGFQLNYDNRLYSSYAEVGDSTAGTDESVAVLSGQTYENNDLRIARAYNYVRIRPIESVEASRALTTLPPEFELFATTSDQELTEAAKLTENKGLSKLSLFVKMDSDRRLAKRVADDNTVVTIEATKASNTTINDVEYQRVRYTTTNENYRITNVKYDECYYTIQYDQPYSICISNVRPANVSAASLVEQVFDSVVYEQAATIIDQSTDETSTNDDQTTSFHPSITLAQATSNEESDAATEETKQGEVSSDTTSEEPEESALLTVTPQYYSDGKTLKSIAKAQPSVVRVGMLYCADLALKFEDGETATTLSDACVGNIASGVFISQDGYIATTGHAILAQKKAAINGYINFAPDRQLMLDRLQRVLDYLLDAKIILDSDAEYLATGASTGDQEALAKIQNIGSIIPDDYITPIDEEYSYAIQPSDKPIVVNRSDTFKPSFAYSDSVLKAEFVAANYDAEKSVQYTFGSETPRADIGLLKVDGNFPDVPIATDENAQANDIIAAVGFTAYTDTTLTIDKVRNLPIANVSRVEQAYQQDGVRFIQTDRPVLPGHDGAPVLDSSGRLMGFAVYGLLYCPDQACFSNGTVRSSTELVELLKENNISLQTGSSIANTWREGVDEFFAANYSASASSFASVDDEYRFNRWASPLEDLSTDLQGSAKDTSLMNQLQVAMIVSLISLTIITVLLAILFWLHKRRISMLQVGHYGTEATVVQNPQPNVSPQSNPVPPQQNPAQPSPTQSPQPPTQPNQSLQSPSDEDPFYK